MDDAAGVDPVSKVITPMNKINGSIAVFAFTTILAAGSAQAFASDAVVIPALYRAPVLICNHEPCPGPDDSDTKGRFGTIDGMGRSVSRLTRSLESRDVTASVVSLGSIFEGGPGGVEAPVVVVPAPQRAIQTARPVLLQKAQRKGAVTLVGWKGCVGGYLAGGAAGCGIGSAAEDGFNEGMDQLGDYLRDN